jgi:hypothetical protein
VPDQDGAGDTQRDQRHEQTDAQPQVDGQPNAPEGCKRCQGQFPRGPESDRRNC